MPPPSPAASPDAAIARWIDVFNGNDADALTALYTSDASLHGTSRPALYRGHGAIRAYFAPLPGSGTRVAPGERHVAMEGDALATGVGFYDFTVLRDGQPVPSPARFTFVLRKTDGDWLITHHHSSSLPPAPAG